MKIEIKDDPIDNEMSEQADPQRQRADEWLLEAGEEGIGTDR